MKHWLKDIKILKFTLFEFIENNVEDKELHLNLNIEGVFDKKLSEISVIVEVLVYREGTNNEKEDVAELKVKNIFKIENAELLDDNNDILLPKELKEKLNEASISTTRGILFTKFQGTNIDDIIIPLIDLNEVEEVEI